MTVIPVPDFIYLPFLGVLSAVWVGWLVNDVTSKGMGKYSAKRVLKYVGSAAVMALLWGLFVG
jgi:hypothetical protein